MTHQTRRGPPVECPLASLGRNIPSALDAQIYHHPLSSSPLNPQVYQMSRKSPNLSIDDTDDIIYTSTESNHHHQDINNGRHHNESSSIEMYHLSRSSSSSMEQHSSHGGSGSGGVVNGVHHVQQSQHLQDISPYEIRRSNLEPIRRRQLPTSRNYTPIENLLQYRSERTTPCTYILHHNNHNNNNNEDSSDNGGGGGGGSGNINNCGISGRRSVPLPTNSSNTRCINQRDLTTALNNHQQYFLEQKMDSLYLQGAIRGLPLGSESNHFKKERYFLEQNLCNYNNESNGRRDDGTDSSRILDNLLESETSGSDRYLIERTSARGSSGFLDNSTTLHNNNNGYSDISGHHSNNSTTNSTTTTNGHLDKRFHPSKVKSLSEGLSNIGRFSPSLDQGYATLVSPSPTTSGHQIPGPWSKKGPCRSGPGFDRLPDQTLLKIFNWLDSCELCNVARVCRRFENLAWQPILWKLISLKGEHISGDKALKMIFRRLCGQSRNGSCPNIERVMLSEGCKVTDKGLQLLTRRCPELTHLQLQSSMNVSNQALCDVLTKCSNLQHLDVTGCTAITSISMNSNFEQPRRLLLQYLDLTDCTAIDDIGLKVVVRNCPQLVYLYLRRCIQITDSGLKFVPSFCIALKELSVSDCINITDFGLYELAKLGAALRYLSVAKCDRVSDAGLKVIARRCYKLRYLNARGCEAVSDDSITFLARSCPRLRALDIGKCDVSDAGLRALAESCPNLKKLSLRNCDMITDRGVQCIAYYCRGLQQLNIQDCQISVEGYRAVKKYCKRCIIEHTNPGFY